MEHPLNDDSLNEAGDQIMLDALMSNRVAVGTVPNRRLLRYMVIRNWVSPVYPHVILPAGLSRMSESVRAYPPNERDIA